MDADELRHHCESQVRWLADRRHLPPAESGNLELARLWLAANPTDDGEPISREWLSAVADEVHFAHWDFVREGHGNAFLRVEVWHLAEDGKKAPPRRVMLNDRDVCDVRTRGDLRRLLSVVGRPLTEATRAT